MDGFLSPIDALRVISRLNNGEGEAGAEGEGGGENLLSATAPPSGELLSSSLLVVQDQLTTDTTVRAEVETSQSPAATAPSSIVTVQYPASGTTALVQFLDASDLDELMEQLSLEETLDELAAAVAEGSPQSVDEIFRQIGDA